MKRIAILFLISSFLVGCEKAPQLVRSAGGLESYMQGDWFMKPNLEGFGPDEATINGNDITVWTEGEVRRANLHYFEDYNVIMEYEGEKKEYRVQVVSKDEFHIINQRQFEYESKEETIRDLVYTVTRR